MFQISPDTGLKVCVGIFLLSSLFLTTSYNATFAFDRPVDTAILVCILLGVALMIWARLVPSVNRPPSPTRKPSGNPFPDQFELPSRNPSRTQSPISSPLSASSPFSVSSPASVFSGFSNPNTPLSWRSRWQVTQWAKVALLAGLCGLRIETFRRITLHTECAPATYEYAVPFAVSLYDYWRNQRSRRPSDYIPLAQSAQPQSPSLSIPSRGFLSYLFQGRLRFVIAASLLLIGGCLASSLPAGQQSTYICPEVVGEALRLRTYKILNILLDSFLLIGIAELWREISRMQELQRRRTLVSLGIGLFGVAFVWTIIGIFVQRHLPEHNGQLFLDAKYSRSALSQALLAVILVLSAWHILPHYGIIGVSILAGFVFIYTFSVSTLYAEPAPFPFISPFYATTALGTSLMGALLFLGAQVASEKETRPFRRTNIVLQVLFVSLFGIGLWFVVNKERLVHSHPIDVLIQNGRINHQNFLIQAKSSNNIEEAVMEYRRRYNQHPPPGFDKWYEYAINRSSVVIDDFPQIYDNLLPFRALRPDQLRDMTHKLATNPFNDLGAISIRNGKARVQEGIKPTHAWMVVGAANMIEKFSEHLPDMDLVFNLNDEPRVAVPYRKARALKRIVHHQTPVPEEEIVNGWSMDRDQGWGPIEPAHQTNETVFTDSSWRGIFDPYPPHSMGQFPLDFNLASDICHQPDLAFLHGLLLSPASFKVSQELVPVFSQSALSSFSDILFPSPWNYMDKVEYKPSREHPDLSWVNKESDLFWIGSTSEGVSRFGEWKGMPRQRTAHLINNNTHGHVSVLLPAGEPDSYRYEVLSGNAPTSQLNLQTNVHLADPLVRCDDCELQRAEMGTVSWVDFQQHWTHKFLFDLDGAGFSGRFLPFLQSHSLPLKTGLFRQWFDSRITSWVHFVPVDIRLHGLWSTLAYFTGVSSNHVPNRMEDHQEQGRVIAEEGRQWVGDALRKEDMEIYFFRLLLEWGRLTDDRRDVLGYKG
ncbi:hypothetical protein N7510_010633 [Penicillium lagena]|uniref:uncharacterized protein n=1 Tax=Penicillium lagena TaxID=94218 RepID=UPI002541E767|nr:uncharacterized protein N7510_010633 [Penicillium lagena]KAJ5601099.1 hypothetical protein N7510_010633 [Penicillium lagena]